MDVVIIPSVIMPVGICLKARKMINRLDNRADFDFVTRTGGESAEVVVPQVVRWFKPKSVIGGGTLAIKCG
jgi:hypothetical protein